MKLLTSFMKYSYILEIKMDEVELMEMEEIEPKMSLLAQFDAVCRESDVIGCDEGKSLCKWNTVCYLYLSFVCL